MKCVGLTQVPREHCVCNTLKRALSFARIAHCISQAADYAGPHVCGGNGRGRGLSKLQMHGVCTRRQLLYPRWLGLHGCGQCGCCRRHCCWPGDRRARAAAIESRTASNLQYLEAGLPPSGWESLAPQATAPAVESCESKLGLGAACSWPVGSPATTALPGSVLALGSRGH